MTEIATCVLCGEPMPPGEEMFQYHGYSGPCPKPPLSRHPEPPTGGDGSDDTLLLIAELRAGARVQHADPGPVMHEAADTIARLRERVAAVEAAHEETAANYHNTLRALSTAMDELSSLKAAGTRADGIEAAATAASFAAWKHAGEDAYSQGMDAGARHQVKACVEAIRALSPAPEAKPVVGDWPARAVIDGDCISIRVPISALPTAFECLPPHHGLRNAEGDPLFEVSDAAEFAKSVTRRLNDEEEDGTTLIHTMLDKAMAEAVEQGDDGIDDIASRFGKEGG